MLAAAASTEHIILPGHNCWRVERAHRFYAIQDGEYYRLVRDALLRARDTVFILGWDLTGGTDLLPGAPPSDVPTRLDHLIAYIARRRPRLRCYILTWDYGPLFTLERDPFSRWRFGWRMPRGVRFGFDDHHPVGACHHQKIVVIDDALAFCGGMDLTVHRWDTPAHRVDEPGRVTPLGAPYGPYHEVQAMADGPLAAALGTLARDRWRAVGKKRLPPVGAGREDLWPAGITPDFTDVDVAIARTIPMSVGHPAVRENEALFFKSIADATTSIYIENQYFTNMKICDALVARLAEPDGPEVILVLPRGGDGWLEQNTIQLFRDKAFRCLLGADKTGRLRLLFPMASRARDVPTFVHAKVTIVDDVLVRIGSANTNHRSMGVDTECDLAIEALDDTNRAAVRAIRNRLLGEHLGMTADAVGAELERAGSLRALIDAHQDADRTLVRFDPPGPAETEPSDDVRNAVDPDEPVAPFDPAAARAPVPVWIARCALAVAAVVVAAVASDGFRRAQFQSVEYLLETIRNAPSAETVAVGVFLVAGFVMLPVEVLVVGAGVVFGALRGGLLAFAGSFAAAIVGYLAGRAIGPAGIGRWMSRRSYRSGRQMARRGTAGVAALRLTSVASAGAIHLLCGADRVPFGQYMAGTVIGLGPAIPALCGFGALAGRTLLQPTVTNAAVTVAAGLLLGALALGLRTIILLRQFSPSLTRHRERAEFG